MKKLFSLLIASLLLASPAQAFKVGGMNWVTTDGTSGQVMKTDGAGSLGWKSVLGPTDLTATAPLTYNSSTGVLAMPLATSLASGYLAFGDWINFNNRITGLSSDVSATGPTGGTGPSVVAATVNAVGGSTAANVHAAELLANAATSSNTASTIVKRDGSGNFTAGTITAALTGTASGNTTYTASNHGVVVSSATNAMTVVAADASTSKVMVSGGSSADPGWALIANTNISSSAAIAYSKLALTGAILNADLAGSIAASKLIGSDIATVGTITAGTWHGTAVGALYGGTGADTSASTGVAKVAAGTWSVASLVNADVSASAAIAYSKLALTGSIVNADVSASAAIAYSKLALTGAILNADLAGSIAYSKLVLTNSVVNADISSSAAIAYSKLALTGSIVNADVGASAAIAYSKLALTGAILNADLAGSIAASKLVGTDIATVGTLTAGATGSGFTVALSTSTITGTLADARLPSSMATKTFTGVTTFPGTSSVDGSGNAIWGGNEQSATSSVGAALVTSSQSSWTSPATATGTAAIAGSTTVTGTSTLFLTEMHVGDSITIAGETKVVASIASDTSLAVGVAFSGTSSGNAITKTGVETVHVWPSGNIQNGGTRTSMTNGAGTSNGKFFAVASAASTSATTTPQATIVSIGYTGNASAGTSGGEIRMYRSRGTEASPSALTSSDQIASLRFGGYDGTLFSASAARIIASTTEAWSATAHGTKLDLQVVPNTTTTLTTALSLGQDLTATFSGNILANGTQTNLSGPAIYAQPTFVVTTNDALDHIGMRTFPTFTEVSETNTGATFMGFRDDALRNQGAGDQGTISAIYGAYLAYGHTSTSGTTANAYGVVINAYAAAGTISANMYDLYLGGLTSGGTLTGAHFGIYQNETTAMNVIGSNTRIGGTSNPTVALDVTGAALISSTLGVSSATDSSSATTGSIKSSGGIGAVKSITAGAGFNNPETQDSSTSTPRTTLSALAYTIMSGAATISISGINVGYSGQVIYISNRTGNTLTLVHNGTAGGGSAPIFCPNAANVSVRSFGSVALIYDNLITGAWMVLAQ